MGTLGERRNKRLFKKFVFFFFSKCCFLSGRIVSLEMTRVLINLYSNEIKNSYHTLMSILEIFAIQAFAIVLLLLEEFVSLVCV